MTEERLEIGYVEGLDFRTERALRHHNIKYLDEAKELTEELFRSMHLMGPSRWEKLQQCLYYHGLIEKLPEGIEPSTSIGTQIKTFEDLMSMMSEREADIIRLRYGLNGDKPLYFKDIGEKYGITTQRASQLAKKGLRKLKYYSRIKYQNLIPKNVLKDVLEINLEWKYK